MLAGKLSQYEKFKKLDAIRYPEFDRIIYRVKWSEELNNENSLWDKDYVKKMMDSGEIGIPHKLKKVDAIVDMDNMFRVLMNIDLNNYECVKLTDAESGKMLCVSGSLIDLPPGSCPTHGYMCVTRPACCLMYLPALKYALHKLNLDKITQVALGGVMHFYLIWWIIHWRR